MVLKRICTSDEAVADLFDGAVVMVSGFAVPGVAQELVKALIRRGAKDLTTVSNSVHDYRPGLCDAAKLVQAGLVSKAITSFPVPPRTSVESSAEKLWQQGKLEVETVPQGTLSERIRAAGIGVGAFWVRTGVGTPFEEGKERRVFGGQEHLLEYAIPADFALIKARRADTLGNLVYDKAQRNYGPIMAMAATVTIVEVDEIVEPGEIAPEMVVTPGIFVARLVLSEST